jgi:predicted PurR-regulated permease PerM
VSAGLKPLLAAAWLAGVILVGSVLIGGRDVLIPFALAALIWQLINAFAARCRKIPLVGRLGGNWLALTLGVVVIGLALSLVVDLIVLNVGAVSAAAPTYEANLLALLGRGADMLGLPQPASLGPLVGQIDVDVWIRRISIALAGFVGSIGLVALYVAFLLLEQASFDRKVDALFPDPLKAASTRRLLAQLGRRVERYLWVKTVFSVATAALSWCVLAAVGCNQASFWALIIFMLNFVPIIGTFFGVAFPALLVLLQFGTLGPFLVSVVGLATIQFGLGTVLEPRMIGSTLHLSPVVIVVSLAVWGSLWGIAGMFLCVPIMVIITIVCAHFAQTRPMAILLSGTGELDDGIPGPLPWTG